MPDYEATVIFRISTDNPQADEDEIADAFRDALEGTDSFFVEVEDGEEYECNPDVWGGIEIRNLK